MTKVEPTTTPAKKEGPKKAGNGKTSKTTKGASKTIHNRRKPRKGNVRMAVTAHAAWTKALPQISMTGGIDGHEEEGCMVCERNDYQTEIVLCDLCNAEYHIFCLKPPLKYVPAGDWFCPSCSGNAIN